MLWVVIPIALGMLALPAAETPIVISNDNTVLVCEPGRTFTAPVLVRGVNNITIRGCTFDGTGYGRNGGAMLEFDHVTGLVFSGNTLQNTVPGMYAALFSHVTNARIENNRLQSIRGPGFSVAEGSFDVEIVRNTVDATASVNGALSGSAIEVKARAASTAGIARIAIRANRVKVSTGFCFEAGQFGGTGAIREIRILEGNECLVESLPDAAFGCTSPVRPRTCGGYSFDDVSDSEIIGNVYNAAGQAVDIAAIELVACRRCTANANILTGDTNTGGNGSSGIVGNCDHCTISGNQITNIGPVYANAMIDLHTTPRFPGIDGNVISGNTLILPEGGVGLKGILLHCNHEGGSMRGTLIAANRIVGKDGAAQGITMAANATGCELNGTEVLANTLVGLKFGLYTWLANEIVWQYNRLTAVAIAMGQNR